MSCRFVDTSQSNEPSNEGQIALLHRQYAELKFDISQIASQLDRIERLLNNIAAVSGRSSSEETVHDGHTFLDKLPLTSVHDINNFNSIITESSEKFNLLVCICIVTKDSAVNKYLGQ